MLVPPVVSLPERPAGEPADVLLDVVGLSKEFPIRSFFGVTTDVVRAVDNVSFSIRRGEVLGLVGESGSGKTTTARCVLRLIEPTSGRVVLGGRDITGLSRAQLRPLRRRLQTVFQDPYSSLDPRQTVEDAVGEGLDIFGLVRSPAERRTKVLETLALVGIDAGLAGRKPAALSGGERQRVCIARAIIVEPELLVCDEPVSSLDASIQAQVLNLLSSLTRRLGLAVLFITHDLRVVRHLCRSVAVMRLGKVVEYATTEQVFASPQHPYTRELLLASPIPDPVAEMERRRQRQAVLTAE